MKNKYKTFKIVVEYDGSFYYGWQRQKEHKTVQGEIETALFVMTGQNVVLNGSGRTDAGVHALGQVASFRVKTYLTSEIFYKGLNSLLSDDIVIVYCARVSNNFHARFDAKFKTYYYYITNNYRRVAIGRRFIWHVKQKLNLKILKRAASYFVGCHDFRTFEGSGSPRKHTIRTITESVVEFDGNGVITYKVEADGFLRFMVRNIVGTLVDVGLGKIDIELVPKLFDYKNRAKAGSTAPPHGLFLVRVDY